MRQRQHIKVLWLVLFVWSVQCVSCSEKSIPTPTSSFTNSFGMTMVSLPKGFYASKYETTQGQFQLVMGYNPSAAIGANQPVENLQAEEAIKFCQVLTEREKEAGRLPAGYEYDLPTWSEWLYLVADAPLEGSVTPVGGKGGSNLRSPLDVGSGEINQYGIGDTRGNVSEWGKDLYNTGSHLVLGPWWNTHRKDFLRKDNKAGLLQPDSKGGEIGFRCILRKQM